MSPNHSAGEASSSEPETSGEASAFPSALAWLQRYPDQPAPQPRRMRMTPIGVAGTMIWAVAAAVLTFFHEDLKAADVGWLLTCAQLGIVIGIIGTVVMVVHDRRGVRANGALREHPDDSE
ncbi:DUF2530 domain-containing protein [Natronoglycomyces albus]|uniref:DUF2530 domain-containing protein n=1 Tax=Natronoglycomyces albus TaxID=2811108 RepID=A0A895XUZ3_9ACTN|nr:DUF2530 domain-containing protein [Natronoglycomyces albus]QSB05468.1 DUF2530 domain-containing protein [Natronoglycomyces albus]